MQGLDRIQYFKFHSIIKIPSKLICMEVMSDYF